MATPQGISHVGIGVTDMERSLRFYCDLLGMHVTADLMQDMTGAASLLSGTASTTRRGVYLRWEDDPDSPFIDLTEHEGAKPGPALKIDQVGIHHFGIWVKNLDQIYERLKTAGTPMLVEPHVGDHTHGHLGKIQTMIFLDPDGTMLQFEQRVD